MKFGSIGDIPPRAIGRPGFSRRIAFDAVITISAKIFQSGSILKSQCERLLGSFHSITASTMLFLRDLLRSPTDQPTRCPQARDPRCTGPRELHQQECRSRSLVPDGRLSVNLSYAALPQLQRGSESTSSSGLANSAFR